jgi:hypothetical protein
VVLSVPPADPSRRFISLAIRRADSVDHVDGDGIHCIVQTKLNKQPRRKCFVVVVVVVYCRVTTVLLSSLLLLMICATGSFKNDLRESSYYPVGCTTVVPK